MNTSFFYLPICFVVNDNLGFGVLDAKALTDGAKQWKNVGPQLNCTLSFVENKMYATFIFLVFQLILCNRW